ncbi:hypothetical protein V2I01_26730 [Micromonospora sp. BRA006-A]|nr:hypothetical protein [Micromonospora sp. BRA006-A]
MCDGVLYFPQSPKRTGAAPHPVALLVGTDMGTRRHDRVYYYDEGLSKRVERTWASEDRRSCRWSPAWIAPAPARRSASAATTTRSRTR